MAGKKGQSRIFSPEPNKWDPRDALGSFPSVGFYSNEVTSLTGQLG